MKILFATGIFPPDIGGPATSVSMLAEAWTRQGHRVTVVTFSDRDDGRERPYEVVRIPRSLPVWKRLPRFLFALRRELKDANVVFAQDGVASGLPAAIAAWLERKRLIIKIVGDFAWERAQVERGYQRRLEEFQKDLSLPPAILALKLVQALVVRRADRVIVPSNYLAGIVRGWGARPERIRTIYNGVHCDVPPPGTREPHRIVAAGRLVPWKHFDVIIKAMSDVLQAVPDARLTIIGDGPEEERLRALAGSPMLSGKIEFVGRLPRDEFFRLLTASGAYVLTSSYEGFSHQLVEAFACRIPVAATRAGGNTELIEDGRNGLLLDVGDVRGTAKALIRLLTEPALAAALVDNAAKDLPGFSVEAQIEQTTRLVVGEGGLRPVLVSRDASAAEPTSDASARMNAYAAKTGALEIVALARRRAMPPERLGAYRLRVVDARWGPWSLWRLVRETLDAARDADANLIVAQDPFEAGLAAKLAARRLKIPFVVEDHGAFYAGSAWRSESALNAIRARLGLRVVRAAAGLRVVSRRAERAYRALGIAAPIEVVPVAMRLPAKPVEPHRGPFTVTYAGRFTGEKRLELLLEAFALVRKERPDARLLLAGEGPDAGLVKERVRELRIAAGVQMRPWTSDLASLFAETDAAVLMSSHEGYSRFVAEAMAYGVPVVMTDVGLAGELLRDGVEGFVVPADADAETVSKKILALAEDPMKRAMMRAAGLRRVETVPASDDIVRQVTDFWKKAAGG